MMNIYAYVRLDWLSVCPCHAANMAEASTGEVKLCVVCRLHTDHTEEQSLNTWREKGLMLDFLFFSSAFNFLTLYFNSLLLKLVGTEI